MSDPIFSINFPARGGALSDGSFETWSGATLSYWTDCSSGGAYAKETTKVKDGTYAVKLTSGSTGGLAAIYQAVSSYSSYAGKRVTLLAWCKATMLGAYVGIGTQTGEIIGGVSHSGSSSWEPIRCMVDVPAGATMLRAYLLWDPKQVSTNAYFDAACLCLGDTYGNITIGESNTYPVDIPEDVLVSGGMTADGDYYYAETGTVSIVRRLVFEGIDIALYRRIRNFFRYITRGPTYPFYYTDRNGETFTARLIAGSLSDAKEVGPDLVDCSLSLRITDRGL